MNEREQKIKRIGFLEGMIEGITIYAIWKDGSQKVGCLEKPLKEVLIPYRGEKQRLETEMANEAEQGGEK